MKDLENTRDYEIESANGIKIRGALEEKGEKVKITLFGKLEVPGDSVDSEPNTKYLASVRVEDEVQRTLSEMV